MNSSLSFIGYMFAFRFLGYKFRIVSGSGMLSGGCRFGIGLPGYRFGIGLDFIPEICGPCGPYMDFPPEICGPYGPYIVFLPEFIDMEVNM